MRNFYPALVSDILTTWGHGQNSHNIQYLSQGDNIYSIWKPNQGWQVVTISNIRHKMEVTISDTYSSSKPDKSSKKLCECDSGKGEGVQQFETFTDVMCTCPLIAGSHLWKSAIYCLRKRRFCKRAYKGRMSDFSRFVKVGL